MTDSLITAPVGFPLALELAKLHAKVETDDELPLLEAFLASAVQLSEHLTGRVWVAQTRELTLDAFPEDGCISRGLRAPLMSVTSIKYDDSAGVEQTVLGADYKVDAARAPARIVPVTGKDWPATADQIAAVRVRYAAGYGTPQQAQAAPQLANLRLWLMYRMTTYGAYREQLSERQSYELPSHHIDGLLDTYRTYVL